MKSERILLIGIVVLWLLLWFTSCNPVRKVLSDPKKLDQVGREWEKQNPCKPLIEYEFIEGAVTTVTDTLLYWNTDTVHRTDSFETVTPILKERIITRTIRKTDTVKIRTEDTRRIDLLTGDLKTLQGKSSQLEKDRTTERKRGNMWMYISIGLMVLIVGSSAIVIYRKLK